MYTHHGPSSAKSQAEEVKRIERGWTKEDGRSKSSEMKKMQEANTYQEKEKKKRKLDFFVVFDWSSSITPALRHAVDPWGSQAAGVFLGPE